MRIYGVVMKFRKTVTKTATNEILWKATQAVAMWCIILNAVANHGWGLLGI
jgi:hypothetical protein